MYRRIVGKNSDKSLMEFLAEGLDFDDALCCLLKKKVFISCTCYSFSCLIVRIKCDWFMNINIQLN